MLCANKLRSSVKNKVLGKFIPEERRRMYERRMILGFAAGLAVLQCKPLHARGIELTDRPYLGNNPPGFDVIALNARALVLPRVLRQDESVVGDRMRVSPLQGAHPVFTVFLTVDLDLRNQKNGQTRQILHSNTATIRYLNDGSWVWQGYPLNQAPDQRRLSALLRRDKVEHAVDFVYIRDIKRT